MTVLNYAITNGQEFTPANKAVLRKAKELVWGKDVVQFKRVEPGPGVVCFGGGDGIRTLGPAQMSSYPGAEGYIAAAFHRYIGSEPHVPFKGIPPENILYFDIESHNAGKQWGMAPEKFFRLGQYAWGPTGEVHLTTDWSEMIRVLTYAEGIVGQNIHPFDLSVLFGKDSTWPLEAAMQNKVFDTMVFASLACPAPPFYTNRNGSNMKAEKPAEILKWLSLDNLSFQLGLDGKEGDLKALAKKYNPPKTLDRDLDYGLIPLDDPDFLAYAVQDVVALQELTNALLTMHEPTEYDWREQLNAAIDAQNSRNGFRVDIPVAQARAKQLTERKEVVLREMEEKYGFPTEGKMPWRTNPGKEAILKALADQGITPETHPDWTKTKTGNISLGGEVLIELTEGTRAEDMGQALAEIMGQRSLAQLALASVQPDGKVHPEINSLQRSGRRSVTRPGLTVWSSRDDKAVEKEYFVPSPGRKLVEFDYSQADARVVAAYSGDVEFAKRFAPGVDAHDITGRIFFGVEKYDANRQQLRPLGKAGGHALAYRVGSRKLAHVLGVSVDEAAAFIRNYQKAYPKVAAWQERVTALGESGQITNDWGRVMQVERDRSFTQSSALLGQSGTACILVDALIRMAYYDLRLITWLAATVHDAIVMDIPETELEWAVPKIKELMECSWGPKDGTGQVIEFPVSHGEPSDNWRLAGH
jgi:DNA polymerase-1